MHDDIFMLQQAHCVPHHRITPIHHNDNVYLHDDIFMLQQMYCVPHHATPCHPIHRRQVNDNNQ